MFAACNMARGALLVNSDVGMEFLRPSTRYRIVLKGVVRAGTGTSSFGMSGVNAHMLLAAAPDEATAPNQATPMSWRPQRFWPGPTLCHLAHPVSADATAKTLR